MGIRFDFLKKVILWGLSAVMGGFYFFGIPEVYGVNLAEENASVRDFVILGLLPQSVMDQNRPINRAQVAQMMATLLKLKTGPEFMVPFPSFRDVPVDHPQYGAIEILRQRRILSGLKGGYFYPERLASHEFVFVILSNMLPESKITAAEMNAALTDFKIQKNMPLEMKRTLATLYNTQMIFLDVEDQDLLNLKQAITPHEIAVMLHPLVTTTLAEFSVSGYEAEKVIDLPGGLNLTVTPSSALISDNLAVGQKVYFILTQPTVLPGNGLIPLGTRLRAEVVESRHKEGEPLQVVLKVDELVTPAGVHYRGKAIFDIMLPLHKGKKAHFIVPGEVYQILTQAR